ncbi:MAG TPA: UDP-N-acetylmuramoyl-tripeptide--D-alanyl-D-alanine ligase [Flavobacteriales bacterium]|nr:UDP-N-acetylmuramoyl-tripeptide--D-alanyl-D-alanine ligase [Flavobacteriales bacterium]HRE97854.1 UDP-N-acetylmuramoyl-tripeptide--D-alanyl-D-alanine ligase [Flavobacteriales bacterium]HRJ35486.1 UDP-N-acetylmuramoyl-tripeptide--D-alanyl-D-alanine ligase [Flavobacteriales bacterium]HRJ39264.1 UDP-N-acetylmuramoyl-tripeptide--D-alanyl-D-alanine ligase [Flavobacteriales bacterium]
MIEQLYSHYCKYPQVVTDTRKLIPGSLFFALKGPNFDANQFAEQALEQGCAMAVVDDPNVVKDNRFFLVGDVLTALQELAKYHRQQLKIPVLALTGSNGKTTTKELMHAVLSEQFNTLATSGNLNNHIGVPLTLLSIRPEHEFAIIEMGANHQKEIAALSRIALPEFGLITNIGKAHIEGFGGVEGIKKGKGELYDFLRTGNFLAFVNADSDVLMEMSEGMNRKLYGHGEGNYMRGLNKGANPFLEMEIAENGKSISVKTQIVGKYNFDNALAAAAVGKYFGLSLQQIKAGLEKYVPENNRSQILQKGNNTLILDAYNANPSSMRVALENFAEMKASNKFFIIGDMLELGDASPEEHLSMIELSRQLGLKGAFVGPLFGSQIKDSSLLHFLDTAAAKKFIAEHPFQQYHILIKGSRGMRLEGLLEVI